MIKYNNNNNISKKMTEEVCRHCNKTLNTLEDIDHLIEKNINSNPMFKQKARRTFLQRWCCCF